jgi:hypothetical protein
MLGREEIGSEKSAETTTKVKTKMWMLFDKGQL